MKLPLRPAILLVSLAISSVSSSVFAQAAPTGSLLVLSKHDHTLAIVEAATLKVIAKVPVGNDPHEVIASTDGATAYVSNYGSGAYNTLAVIDLVRHQAMPSVDLGPLRGPHGLTFVGGKTWFTSETAKAIGRYDPATNKVDWILGTGQNRTHMVYVSEDQKRLIATNVMAGTVSLIELEPVRMPPQSGAPGRGGPPGGGQRMDWNQTVIPVGKGSEGFDLSPDKREIWVANAQDGTISIIDVASKKVVQTLEANVPGANRLKFTVDGKQVLVTTLSGPDLVVLDAATRKEIKRVPIGHGAAGILIEPGGTRAFVACTPDDYVAVIDLQSLKVTSHIQVGPEPDGMAWAVEAK
jgi:YVTN family beta-propeller protein